MSEPRFDHGSPSGKRFGGPRVVLVGIIIVLLISGFVVTRIVQTSGPGPDPETIPDRPGRSTQG